MYLLCSPVYSGYNTTDKKKELYTTQQPMGSKYNSITCSFRKDGVIVTTQQHKVVQSSYNMQAELGDTA